jgi:hypothetical protein
MSYVFVVQKHCAAMILNCRWKSDQYNFWLFVVYGEHCYSFVQISYFSFSSIRTRRAREF